jgi:hypothetical protein
MQRRVLTFCYAERPALTAGATTIATLAVLALIQALGN